MSTTENKALVQRLVEETVHRRNPAIMDDLIAPDFVNHSAPAGVPPTREGYRQYAAALLASFPDFHLTINDLIAEGDKVAIRYTVTGTQEGPFLGIPGTGKKISVNGMGIMRIVNGQIVERWEQVDTMTLLQQLGVMPAPASG